MSDDKIEEDINAPKRLHKPTKVDNVMTSLKRNKKIIDVEYSGENDNYLAILDSSGTNISGKVGSVPPVVTIEKNVKGGESAATKLLEKHEDVQLVNTYSIDDLFKFGDPDHGILTKIFSKTRVRRENTKRRLKKMIKKAVNHSDRVNISNFEEGKRQMFFHDIKYSDEE